MNTNADTNAALVYQLHGARFKLQQSKLWLGEDGNGPDSFHRQVLQMYDAAIAHVETDDLQAAIDDLKRFPSQPWTICRIVEELLSPGNTYHDVLHSDALCIMITIMLTQNKLERDLYDQAHGLRSSLATISS